MAVILFMILVACVLGAFSGLLAALGIWLRLIFSLLDALVQQVPRGVNLFFRLAYALVVRSVKTGRWLYRLSSRVGLWLAQHAYIWLFVWSYRLRRAYVASELRKRGA
jgi:hypothetical protein